MNSTTLLKSVELFQLYYTPVLVFLGAIGNGLCVYVFRSPKLQKLSSSCYLSALAVSDTVFLVALFTVWLTMVGKDIFNQPGSCQLLVYLTAVCSFLSVWFVVAFTIERFVAVRYPLLRHSLCTVQRAKIILSGLTVFALGLYAPLLVFADAKPMCTVEPLWQDAAGVFNVLDTIVTFVIPVFIIVILNTWITCTVWKLDKIRKRLTQRRDDLIAVARKRKFARGITKRKAKYSGGAQKKVTKMLLLVSTIFLCFNLPSYIMRVLTYFTEFQMLSNVDVTLFTTVQHICMQFFNTNFGINFILYCIGGVNFRRAVIARMCSRKRRKTQRGTTTPVTHSDSRTVSSTKSYRASRLRQISTSGTYHEMVPITNEIQICQQV